MLVGEPIRSTTEVQSLLYVAMDNGYIEEERFEELFALTKQAAQKATAFRNYLRKRT